LGKKGLRRIGRARWRRKVHRAVRNLSAAFGTDYIVLGGGNVDRLKKLPRGARRGDNNNAFIGGARLWGHAGSHVLPRKQHIWVIT
jgi:hypothetical protein